MLCFLLTKVSAWTLSYQIVQGITQAMQYAQVALARLEDVKLIEHLSSDKVVTRPERVGGQRVEGPCSTQLVGASGGEMTGGRS